MKVGIIADLHAGSMFAPWPADADLSTKGRYIPNIGQQYLNENLARIAREIPPLDVLILDGDIIDGNQWRNQGRFVVEEDPQFQARAAKKLLEPFVAKSRVIYACEGTQYHDGEVATWSENLAKDLGAIPQDEHYAWDWLLLEINGVKFDVAHHQSYMIRYRSTPAERELQFSAMLPDSPDVIVRAHVHNYLMLQMPTGRGGIQTFVSCPPWQMSSHYCHTSTIPNRKVELVLGMVVIDLDNGVTVKPYVFEHPPFRRSVYVTS